MITYSVIEISSMLNVNQETVRRWIRSGKLKTTIASRKQGNVISEKDLEDFACNNPKYAKMLGLEYKPSTDAYSELSNILDRLIEERDEINRQIKRIQLALSIMEES